MHSQLNHMIGRERIADLHRDADSARLGRAASSTGLDRGSPPLHETISIRRASEADSAALLLLATLDSAPPLGGDVLIAHVAGAPWAAIDTDSGATVADPFRPTAHVVELLGLRAAGLRQEQVTTRRPWLRRRWASGTVAS